MAEYPLLRFRSPEETGREKGGGFPRSTHYPTRAEQAKRLEPQFRALQSAFRGEHIVVHGTPPPDLPERTLVLKTIGPVKDFLKAAKNVKGLDFLAELDERDIPPDEYFYDKKDRDKKLSGTLYWVLSDQSALEQLLSLWNRWKKGDNRWDRGLAPVGHLFEQLRDIRLWDVQDRMLETGILATWREDLQLGNIEVSFEAEFCYTDDQNKRRQREKGFVTLLQNCGGSVVDGPCIIPAIRYHGILGKIPRAEAGKLVNQEWTQLVRFDSVMFFRPVAQASILPIELDHLPGISEAHPGTAFQGPPVIALLDGLPLEHHTYLENGIIVDDPDGWSEEYPATARQHGTAMASLILWGDLNAGTRSPLSRKLYVRPLLFPLEGIDGGYDEVFRDGRLAVDKLHEAVRRIVADDGNVPECPTVRIVNYSIGDSDNPFMRFVSPCARLIDWLSFKYNLLFIVSAGNQQREIALGLHWNDFTTLAPHERERLVVQSLANDGRNRRLLSPAESINALSVGAIHEETEPQPAVGNLYEPYVTSGMVSPISAQGPGYRRSIKPDVLASGGRLQLIRPVTDPNGAALKVSRTNRCGVGVASPGSAAGQLDARTRMCGTSCAAALVSHYAGSLYEYLDELRKGAWTGEPDDSFTPVLVKALLVHTAAWDEQAADLIGSTCSEPRVRKEHVSRFLGYGSIEPEKMLGCSPTRATVVSWGMIAPEQVHKYQLPLPEVLSGQGGQRRLVVTLAWLSPIQAASMQYRAVRLELCHPNRERLRELLGTKITESNGLGNSAAIRGTLQHEVFQGNSAAVVGEDDVLSLSVECRVDAPGTENIPVRYGLAVTIEVAPEIGVPIYEQIRDRLRVPIRVRP